MSAAPSRLPRVTLTVTVRSAPPPPEACPALHPKASRGSAPSTAPRKAPPLPPVRGDRSPWSSDAVGGLSLDHEPQGGSHLPSRLHLRLRRKREMDLSALEMLNCPTTNGERRRVQGEAVPGFHSTGPRVLPGPTWPRLGLNSNTLNYWLPRLTEDSQLPTTWDSELGQPATREQSCSPASPAQGPSPT